MGLTVRNGAPSIARTSQVAIREGLTAISRAIEDVGWQNLSIDDRDDVHTYDERRNIIARARLYRRRNPLAKQASTLLVNYTIGQGVSLTAANKPLVAKIVDEFWENPVNREAFTSHSAMSEFMQGASVDGIQYLVLFPDTEEGTVELSTLDPLYVEDEIRDPDNWRVPKWYKVRRPRGTYDFKAGQYVTGDQDFVFYRHWRNTDSLGGKTAPKKVETGLVMPCKRGRGKFGESDLAVAVDWLKAHKEFMEDRATVARAAASIAWKKKRKGGVADVKAEVDRLSSTLQTNLRGGPGWDTNPPPASGATIVENDLSNLEWVKTDTGGTNALADERILRMMAGSAMGGIPNHYFGDEANANLATATAMELPLLKMYENWQKWLADIIGDLITFVLETAHEAGNLGPRDDSAKYSDRSVTAQQVLALPGSAPQPGAPGGGPGQTGQQQPATTTGVREDEEGLLVAEADVTVKVSDGKNATVKKADGVGGAGTPTDPAAPPPPPATEAKTFSMRDTGSQETNPDKPVDWYVDIDFPPIVQKDTLQFMQALSALQTMLPTGNPESQRLIAQLALTAVGVNDIDQTLDRLYPALPAGVKPAPLQIMPGGLQGLPSNMRAPFDPNPNPFGPGHVPVPGQQQVREAAITPYRVRTMLRAASAMREELDRAQEA